MGLTGAVLAWFGAGLRSCGGWLSSRPRPGSSLAAGIKRPSAGCGTSSFVIKPNWKSSDWSAAGPSHARMLQFFPSLHVPFASIRGLSACLLVKIEAIWALPVLASRKLESLRKPFSRSNATRPNITVFLPGVSLDPRSRYARGHLNTSIQSEAGSVGREPQETGQEPMVTSLRFTNLHV